MVGRIHVSRSIARIARVLLVGVVALACLDVPAFACDSCKVALATNRGFANGLNDSIYFMLTMTYSLPIVFLSLVWFAHRSNKRRERAGEGFRPEGKIRWDSSRVE